MAKQYEGLKCLKMNSGRRNDELWRENHSRIFASGLYPLTLKQLFYMIVWTRDAGLPEGQADDRFGESA
jgi:hypothetical protein